MDYKKLVKVVDSKTQYYVCLETSRDVYDIEAAAEGSCTVEEFMDALSPYDEENVYFSNDRGYTYGTLRNSIDVDGEIVILDVGRDGYSVDQIARTLTAAEVISELDYAYSDSKIVFRHDGGYTYGYVNDSVIKEVAYEQEEEDTTTDDERVLEDIADEGSFSWYKGKEVHQGCWYVLEYYALPEDFEEEIEKIKSAFKGRTSNWKQVNNHTMKFVLWDSEEACSEFGA